ncbi:malonyl-[acyl-carrier protein] O-methyltransferase BioC [Halioglobus maricola]|uniref:Malonyl-[acyl-carrier protein] O-methyltransferase n=1 Tax=Halioglobus maricola TaxID=2601894 RepID=A0A5P9NFI3_9GAMM|nr:malonyl-ACP O-methyltransferase BioC [Halioglobus maricola]QFU74256.1 malonyl-[acyl-carrier protein] O-methyltransferase BioC [Halioglobus maricola]
MKLVPEYLPANSEPGLDLVLLHGWGANREVWRPLLAYLRSWANVTLLDLPGLAPDCDGLQPELDALLDSILEATPQRAVYLGWSLGGQLALALAERAENRVEAVITLCSNPRFVADENWPGMAAPELAEFQAACAADPRRTLRRFDSLQVAGALVPRPLLRALQASRPAETSDALGTGLSWLATLDQRIVLSGLQIPHLHLLAANDQLHPPGLAEALRGIATGEVEVLPDCSHAALLEQPATINTRLQAFFRRCELLPGQGAPVALAKSDVADSFSRAAAQYDSVAQLQRDVGERLLQQIGDLPEAPATVLDLGSGTGYFCTALKAEFPDSEYIGLDLAEGMVRFAREAHPAAGQWLVADAEALPLAANSVDLVFSSLAIQWCLRPELLFAEIARVLRPGGRCVFTSLGPATLHELRSAWATVDEHQHVNAFLPLTRLESAAVQVPGISLTANVEPFRMEYQQVRELLNELKTLGAHNVNRDRPAGLTGRRALQGMLQAYEKWRQDGVLPASYEVFFGTLEKL